MYIKGLHDIHTINQVSTQTENEVKSLGVIPFLTRNKLDFKSDSEAFDYLRF
jgi:hypothetical protein